MALSHGRAWSSASRRRLAGLVGAATVFAAMDLDRIERLVTQVLEETRAFRQEVLGKFASVDDRFAAIDDKFAAIDDKFAAIDDKFADVRRDIGLVQIAVLETAQRVTRVETKLDRMSVVQESHGARLDALEASAAE